MLVTDRTSAWETLLTTQRHYLLTLHTYRSFWNISQQTSISITIFQSFSWSDSLWTRNIAASPEGGVLERGCEETTTTTTLQGSSAKRWDRATGTFTDQVGTLLAVTSQVVSFLYSGQWTPSPPHRFDSSLPHCVHSFVPPLVTLSSLSQTIFSLSST